MENVCGVIKVKNIANVFFKRNIILFYIILFNFILPTKVFCFEKILFDSDNISPDSYAYVKDFEGLYDQYPSVKLLDHLHIKIILTDKISQTSITNDIFLKVYIKSKILSNGYPNNQYSETTTGVLGKAFMQLVLPQSIKIDYKNINGSFINASDNAKYQIISEESCNDILVSTIFSALFSLVGDPLFIITTINASYDINELIQTCNDERMTKYLENISEDLYDIINLPITINQGEKFEISGKRYAKEALFVIPVKSEFEYVLDQLASLGFSFYYRGEVAALFSDPINGYDTKKESVVTIITNKIKETLIDSDSDSIPDWYEIKYGLNPYDSSDGKGTSSDKDSDGLTNFSEYIENLNPSTKDTDGDGLPDKWEIDNYLNPLKNDAYMDYDGDKITNIEEYNYGLDPDEIPSSYLIYDSLNDKNDPKNYPYSMWIWYTDTGVPGTWSDKFHRVKIEYNLIHPFNTYGSLIITLEPNKSQDPKRDYFFRVEAFPVDENRLILSVPKTISALINRSKIFAEAYYTNSSTPEKLQSIIPSCTTSIWDYIGKLIVSTQIPGFSTLLKIDEYIKCINNNLNPYDGSIFNERDTLFSETNRNTHDLITYTWFVPGRLSLEEPRIEKIKIYIPVATTPDIFFSLLNRIDGRISIDFMANTQYEVTYSDGNSELWNITTIPKMRFIKDRIGTVPLDSDADGLPDYWEDKYNLNKYINNTNNDPDGDGFVNLVEYQGESNPNDSNSLPNLIMDININVNQNYYPGNEVNTNISIKDWLGNPLNVQENDCNVMVRDKNNYLILSGKCSKVNKNYAFNFLIDDRFSPGTYTIEVSAMKPGYQSAIASKTFTVELPPGSGHDVGVTAVSWDSGSSFKPTEGDFIVNKGEITVVSGKNY